MLCPRLQGSPLRLRCYTSRVVPFPSVFCPCQSRTMGRLFLDSLPKFGACIRCLKRIRDVRSNTKKLKLAGFCG